MTTAIVQSLAGERIPHGSPVRIDGDVCLIEADLAAIDGITKRPPQTHATHHDAGELVLIETDGGIMAEIDRQPRWVELRKGKIINGEANGLRA